MINFLKWRFYRKVYLLTLTAMILLFPILYILSPVSAQEPTISLNISVTNPSDKETQEVEVRTDLPEELKVGDIISSDGLEVGFDEEKSSLFVKGKVLLQPAETTIYKIEVRDVWIIPGSEGVPVGDIAAHIAAYREYRKEMSTVHSIPSVMREGLERKTRNGRRNILIVILAVFFGAVVYVIIKKKEMRVYLRNKLREFGFGDRRRFVRLPVQAEVEHRLLPQTQAHLVTSAKNISEGGICLSLERPYSPQSVMELKIKLPTFAERLTFRGFVVWQKKISLHGKKEYYLTGISFGEVEKKEDYEKLKTFISKRSTRFSKLLKRSSY